MFFIRDLAQPGRALALGARCRRFESYSPDQRIDFKVFSMKVCLYVYYLVVRIQKEIIQK